LAELLLHGPWMLTSAAIHTGFNDSSELLDRNSSY
jgi:hypothetical protein